MEIQHPARAGHPVGVSLGSTGGFCPRAFNSPHVQTVAVRMMGEGRGPGNVTLELFASVWLRGPAAGGSQGAVEGAAAGPWTPAWGAQAPALLSSGDLFLY